MKIEVRNYVEHEDGSASFQLDMDEEATNFLVQEGFTSLIKKAIDEEKNDICPDKLGSTWGQHCCGSNCKSVPEGDGEQCDMRDVLP